MKIRVCVLFGGKSVEHEVSIISALQAIQNLDSEKYDVIAVYMSKEGRFYSGDRLFEIENYKYPERIQDPKNEIMLYNDGKIHEIIFLKIKKKFSSRQERRRIDIILPIVHGTNVEDGALQGYLRTLQIPFAGCDVLASAIGMEKTVMKMVLAANDIPVVPFVSFSSKQWLNEGSKIIDEIENKLKYPFIIKPSNLGSSIGIKAASNRVQLVEAIDYARQFSLKILVENKISNLKEINCAVVGDYEIQTVSACERPISKDEILSFADKYLSDPNQKGMSGSDRELPAKIDENMREMVSYYAKKSFVSLDCNGVSRIDFLVDLDNNRIYVNEINTIPGSLAFYLFEPNGMTYRQLLDELIGLALKRDRENKSIEYEYKTNILSIKGQKGKKR